MTPPYKLQIAALNADSDEAVHLLTWRLKENGWNIPAVMGEESAARAFASSWIKISNTKSRDGMRQGLYELRSVRPIEYPDGSMRKAKPEDLDLAVKWGNSFRIECFGESEPYFDMERLTETLIKEGSLYFWVNPEPLSMAAFTRPTAHGISISYVYTPPDLRRKGFAYAIVAKMSRLALDEGKKFCTLFTDLNNPTSNSIYQKIGYKPVADIIEVHFTPNN